jgi:hypothetical protein
MTGESVSTRNGSSVAKCFREEGKASSSETKDCARADMGWKEGNLTVVRLGEDENWPL